MTAAVYALAAVLVATLATRAWMLDHDDPARRAFMGLGWSLFVAWLSFAVSLLPDMGWVRALWTLAGSIAPAYALSTIEAIFPRPLAPPRSRSRLIGLAWLVGGVAALVHGIGWGDIPRASPPEVVAGVFAFGLTGFVVRRLAQAHDDAELPSQRTRLGWLLGTVVLSSALALAEFVARTMQPVVDETTLPFLERGLTLQGAIPPMSAIVTAFAVYLLYHAVLAMRLVALQEVFAHLLVASLGASVLLVAHSATLRVIALTRFPFHGGFSLFLLSAAWLSAWEAVRKPLLRRMLRWLRHPGSDLDEAMDGLLRTLPGTRDPDAVAARVVAALHGSGRTGFVGVWILDRGVEGCRLRDHRGPGHIPTVVGLDAARRAALSEPWSASPTSDEALGMLSLLQCDHLLPLRDGDAILGWIGLRDAVYADGFTDGEWRRLQRVADVAGRVLGNVDALARMAEEQRLASLGALSAGLAHEIRNPLAGLKGAAQLLQRTQVDGDAREMLDVVVGETDRLDKVVAAFLDYARPMQPARAEVDVGALVHRVVQLARAGGLSPDVALQVQIPDDLPPARLDRDRLAQVLLNLLRNAVEAVGDGGHVEVIATDAGDGELVLSVRDDGPGLPDEVRDRLFTPFVTTKPGGTGLGLAISQRIVESHGGWIDALDRPGGGTTMVVTLPHVLLDKTENGQGTKGASSVSASSSDGTTAPAPGA